ncbi:MAG: nicotinate-nucleotide adenylyltransferase [Geminicoccaceae bacterium]
MTALCRPKDLRRPVARLTIKVPAEPQPAAHALRVGLLGGSFNPAHEGHRYISLEALKRLGLDQVWWLVSPQNPLKTVAGMAPLAERVAGAAGIARHPRLRVLPLETRLGTRYTADTLARLARWPGHRFVWLMGADNLAQLPQWHRWRGILEACPVAIFERHPYSYGALAGAAARSLATARRSEADAGSLVMEAAPAWVFMRMRPHPASATAIRAGIAVRQSRSGWGETR